MRRKAAVALLLSMVAFAAGAQKGPVDALGFQSDKLYDFNNLDAVNLFNGNLTISIPIGIRYKVSSSLSYQFVAVYNGKIWDEETWTCTDDVTGAPKLCVKQYLNLRSNAGVGWRVSLGRLLPPYDAGLTNDSLADLEWVYEGPAGDEHGLGASSTATVQTNVHDGMRMRRVDAVTRDVELSSGEVHRFVFENSAWRLKQMRDRYANAVNISYVYDTDAKSELRWTVSDTVGRTHDIGFINYPSMHDGWSRGRNVNYMSLQAAGGSHALYNFSYTQYAVQSSCYSSPIPALTSLASPDGSSFQFAYNVSGSACHSLGTLNRMTYPTGAVASYDLGGFYQLGAQTTICRNANTDGISSRTINEGTTTREWRYLQSGGPILSVTPQLSDLCGNGLTPPYNGPQYWSRTSVLEPVDAANHRVRTDHYFDVYSDASDGFTLNYPLPSIKLGLYSHSGAGGVPPVALRKLAAPVGANYSGDVDGADDAGSPQRLLATEVYESCDVNGDCTAGRLLRRTYDRHDGNVNPNRPYGHPIDTSRLVSRRTVYADDTACGSECYTQFSYSDDNGAGQFRTTTLESNFPGAKPITSTVKYDTWSTADLISQTKAWLLGTYTERTRQENGITNRETFCFNNDRGVLLRHRVLAGETAGPHDVLHVASYDDVHGDLQFISDYGGDIQSIDTGSLCAMGLPAQPWYKMGNSYTTTETLGGPSFYTGGVPTSSQYYDRATAATLGFLSVDRTIDRWTGVVTRSRDSAGVETVYSYDPVPARLHSMKTPAGAETTYAYTNATFSAGGSWTAPAKVDVSTRDSAGAVALASQFVYDGMGHLTRSAMLGPTSWSATETTYDGEGRVATRSEPESTGQSPPVGALVAANKTAYTYDAFGRTKSVTMPDGTATTVDYVGDRLRTRNGKIFTGAQPDTSTAVTEQYDGFGRLVTVTEKSGPTTATSVIGADVVTTYAYDVANRLTTVKMRASDGSGPVQNRIFDYDGRGFLRWESLPESGMTSYEYDPRGHSTSKTQSGANSLFDLMYTFDSAERLRRVDGRNPFYSASNPNPSQPQFRVMKVFDFEDSTNDGSNLRKGKLVRAVRYNYGVTSNEPVFKIEDTFKYGDVAGRKTDRNTTISQFGDTYNDVLQSLDTSVAYDELDQAKTMKYPMCVGCGTPPTDPDRSLMTRTYAAGRLRALSGYITDISYWPNGMRNIISHSNGIADTQKIDNMPRPAEISFGRYDRCLRPTFAAQPVGGQVSVPGASFVLTVSVAGTGPFEFQWWNKTSSALVGSTQSITVNPIATTEYYVMVTNACGFEQSQDAKVTIASCAQPATGNISAVAQPDGSWILTPRPEARQPRSYSWRRLSDNALLGTSETLSVGVLAVTTTFRFTITDGCGSATSDVTVNVPLPTTTGLQATAINTTQVAIIWPPIAGASQYTLDRRSLGVWSTVATTASTSYTDSGLTPERTYVYRVTSNNGGRTDYDIATTMTFTAMTPGQMTATARPFEDMLTAVNKVREAVGWPALTWSNILAAGDPVPSPGQRIVARQVVSCRARMNEALQALGVRVRDYTSPDLTHVVLSALVVNEVQQRAQ